MSRPIRVLELRSVRGTGGGPEKTILLGAARSDPARFAVTVCYIRDERDEIFHIDERAKSLDIDYVEVRERHSFDHSIWRALRTLVRDRRIDIVHAHDYKTDLIALFLARAEKAIALTTVHGWSETSLRQRFYYYFDRRLLAWYPIVIAVSEPIRQIAIAHGAKPARVRHLPNGIDAADFRSNPAVRRQMRDSLGISPDTVVIGAVGRLEPIKRFDVLIDAAARLASTVSPLVIVAGDGSCRAALIEQARSKGLGERVILLGHREDVREVHQLLDVYIQTSDSEGIPNAILEAMALETPIVATNVGGTSELVVHGVHGLLVPAGDAEEVARAVQATLDDRESTRARVAAARARVEHDLSFDRRVAAVEAIYEELIRMHSRGDS